MNRLEELIKAGSVYVQKGEYVGIASDGVEVSLGLVGRELSILSYLETHPSPTDW